MLVLLPLSCLVVTALALRARGRTLGEAVLDAAAVVGCVVVLITELTSLVHHLERWTAVVFWLAATAGATWLWVRERRHSRALGWPRLRPSDLPLLTPPTVVGLAALLSAVLSAPNNWDSMTYHLARVMHWIGNGSVEHYPTSILRQLYQPPWAEYALTQLQLLSGGDRCAALLQWLAFLGCIAGVSSITRRLGGGRRAQLLAAATTATIPMAVVQASSTQNDLVAAFWLLALSSSTLRLAQERPRRTPSWLALGAALGLALLTKGTCYLWALPILGWLALALARSGRHVRRGLLAAVAIVVALNAAFWVRNARTFGSPLGPGREGDCRYLNDVISPASMLSGLVRNAALHVAQLEGPGAPRTNEYAKRFLRHLRIDPNDPRTTWAGETFDVSGLSTHEDLAGNPIHFLACLVAMAISLVVATLARARRETRWPALAAWSLCVGLGFVLFSVALKWQPWHSRLHLPFFVLAAPILACAVEVIPLRWVSAATALVLLYLAMPSAFANSLRPLRVAPSYTPERPVFDLARDDQYFAGRGELREPYQRAARCVRATGCSAVGLLAGNDDWEYPLWVLLGHGGTVRLEHLEVNNVSAETPGAAPDFGPCALVAFERQPTGDWGLTPRAACGSGTMGVYLR